MNDFDKVCIRLLYAKSMNERVLAKEHITEEKNFIVTFSDLPAGFYQIVAGTGDPSQWSDTTRAGAFREEQTTSLGLSEQNVKFRYANPLKDFLGNAVIEGELQSLSGKSVPHRSVGAIGYHPRHGEVLVTQGRTGEDGKFRIEGLRDGQPFQLVLPDQRIRLGTVIAGDSTAQRFVMPPEPGDPAPDFPFQTLATGEENRLRNLRGQIVLVDFWATWCAPCQKPMAHLNQIAQKHPEWKDKVFILGLSVDERIGQPRQHIRSRGWDLIHQAWAGEGAFQSEPARVYNITGIPTTIIIDAAGKIRHRAHPAALNIEEEITKLLAEQKEEEDKATAKAQ